MRKIRPKIALVALVLVAAAVAVPSIIGLASAGDDHSLTAVAASATGRFHNLDAANAAGWTVLVKDKAGLSCIDNQPVGGMGVHYANPSILFDANLDPTQPEALVYAPNAAGQPKLAALEYIVFDSAWKAAGHADAPSLFGQTFCVDARGQPVRPRPVLVAARLDLAAELGRAFPALESESALLSHVGRASGGLCPPLARQTDASTPSSGRGT